MLRLHIARFVERACVVRFGDLTKMLIEQASWPSQIGIFTDVHGMRHGVGFCNLHADAMQQTEGFQNNHLPLMSLRLLTMMASRGIADAITPDAAACLHSQTCITVILQVP